jgi:DNA helicase TIP49 (TBP-interacting protein)
MARRETKTERRPMNFESMQRVDVPQGRNGKHKPIVTKIIADLDRVSTGTAIKVPLESLDESKAKVRSALNRATRKAGRRVATASDEDFLYVWNER